MRLPEQGGEWINRGKTLRFRFEGRDYEGLEGDTIASALWANGVKVLGRSFKYHRPRGILSAANHDVIHKHIARKVGAKVILDIENHHNFAWKETHMVNGEKKELIVHRKGATPAGKGVVGIIPGSMATPGYVVRGKGVAESMNSASHGAGRRMSCRFHVSARRISRVREHLQ